MRVVEALTLRVEMDPYISVKALAGYSGLSARTLRRFLSDEARPLPHFRLGAVGRDGKRGAKVLVRRSEFDKWIERWRAQRAAPPKDLDAIVAAAMQSAACPRKAPKKYPISAEGGAKSRHRKALADRA